MPSSKLHGKEGAFCVIDFNTVENRDIKAPIIIQVSQGGSAYFAGKGLSNDKQQASILGAISAAHHIRLVSKAYGVYVKRLLGVLN